MAWTAIDNVCSWVHKRKKLFKGVVEVAAEELAGAFPGGRIAYKLVGELTKYGIERLKDPAAEVDEIKPAGQPMPTAQLDEINGWLEQLTTSYSGLLDKLEALAADAPDTDDDLSALVRKSLAEREDLAQEFAEHRVEVRQITLSLSRVEEKLDEQIHVQNRMAVSLEDYKKLLVELPGFTEYLQLPADQRSALMTAQEHFRAGRRDEGAAALLGLLQKHGIGQATIAHQLGLVYLGQGKAADARRCLEKAGAAGAASPATRVVASTAVRNEKIPPWRSLPRGFLVARRFRVESEVGRGGMASVYRAVGTTLVNRGQVVALKVPAHHLMTDDSTRERFIREIEVSQHLSAGRHPNIVQTIGWEVFDEPHTGQELYALVLEFVQGQTLAGLIAKRRLTNDQLSPDEIRGFLMKVGEGLAYAHGQAPPVLHRDIKPQNVMISADGGVVKLMDFGIARVLDSSTGHLTGGIGTEIYMPPEMYGPNQSVDERTDVYLLGNLLLELMTFDPKGDPEQREDCPPHWLDLIADSMSTVRRKRPASVRAFLDRMLDEDRVPVPIPAGAGSGGGGGGGAAAVASGQRVIVDKAGRGGCRTIGEALKQARPGSTIVVRPGVYEEAVPITKSVEIVGDGPRKEIILRLTDPLELKADRATVRGVTLHNTTPDKSEGDLSDSGAYVTSGTLELEDCDLTSDTGPCASATGAAAQLILRRCTVRDSKKEAGVAFYNGSGGLIEDCDLLNLGGVGLVTHKGANPTVRGSRLRDGKSNAVVSFEKGRGVLENCEVSGHELPAVVVKVGGVLTVRGCKVHDNKSDGVLALETGSGTVQDCELSANAGNGAKAASGANLVLRECKVHHNAQNGVLATEDGRATVEGGSVTANKQTGIAVIKGSRAEVRNCAVSEGESNGITFIDNGGGTVENCEIFENAKPNIGITRGSNPTLRECKIRNGKSSGVVILEGGLGTFENCDIFSNEREGLEATGESKPVVRNCIARGNKLNGLHFSNKAAGRVDGGDVYGNGKTGIAVLSGASPSVRECKVHDNQGNGIASLDGGAGTFDRCEVFANTMPGVGVTKASTPTLRGCVVRDNNDHGAYVSDQGQGTFEECEFTANKKSGVGITSGGNPAVRGCKLHHMKEYGVHAFDNGQGVVENCDIFANTLAGVMITKGATPIVRGCQIHDGEQGGLFIPDNGHGTIDGCEIFNNKYAGIEIVTGSNPTVRNCVIRDGQSTGVTVRENGKGTFAGCTITGNIKPGMNVSKGADPQVRNCKFVKGKDGGIFVYEGGKGTFEGCDISENKLGGLAVISKSAEKLISHPVMRRCQLHNGQDSGAFVYDDGQATIEDCDIYENRLAGIAVTKGGNPTVKNCQIHHGGQDGVYVLEKGQGTFENCTIYENALHGTEVTKDGVATFKQCKLIRNKERAVKVGAAGVVTLTGCDLTGNVKGAFLVESGGRVTKTGCRE